MASKAYPQPGREPGFLGEQSKDARRRSSPSISLSFYPMRGEPGAGRGEALGRPDMILLAAMPDRVQPPGFVGPVIDAIQRKALVADALEQPPMPQLHAGEDVARTMPPG